MTGDPLKGHRDVKIITCTVGSATRMVWKGQVGNRKSRIISSKSLAWRRTTITQPSPRQSCNGHVLLRITGSITRRIVIWKVRSLFEIDEISDTTKEMQRLSTGGLQAGGDGSTVCNSTCWSNSAEICLFYNDIKEACTSNKSMR